MLWRPVRIRFHGFRDAKRTDGDGVLTPRGSRRFAMLKSRRVDRRRFIYFKRRLASGRRVIFITKLPGRFPFRMYRCYFGLMEAFIDQVIASRGGRPGALLAILEAVQNRHPQKYLPEETLRYIATAMKIPFARIYSVATFYALFNLRPQGEHTICICRGTACHTRGSRSLLESVKLDLGINGTEEESPTSPDGKFTVRTVACFGQCALAPVVEVDHRICGHVNERSLAREVAAVAEGHDQ